MKLLLSLTLFFSISYCVAQPTIGAANFALASANSNSNVSSSAAYADGDSETYKKNNVKINLSSLALNNYSLSYERSLTRKISFVAGYRFMPEKSANDLWLTQQVTKRFLEDVDDLSEDLENVELSNNAVTGELRFYTGSKPGARGFYLSLYGRYTNMKGTYTFDHDTETETYTIPLQADLKGIGGGLMLGSQWLIAKTITLDWYLIGAHYGKLKGDLNAVTDLSTMSADEKADLEQKIETAIVVGDKQYIEATVTDRGVNGKSDSPFIGIRGLGFSLGIAF
ncbi:DUF3575 domain-containing protein [Pontibacter harenae]|uniref:DUF3575 domain-containing protein n=1 Tax=Pontibacter harenae TaxID=2894083 RepID=UPI001E3ED879|nr:DUF3575 domain-containing protein [Pontibacter harenae]MCC9166927.1 DUF3575 domain-containing protein [Pontibacter harenae]